MSDVINVPMAAQRDIRTITAEIKVYVAQGMMAAIEIGRRLAEAKAMLPHGEWGAWLSEEVNISSSNAQIYMNVFKEYGDGQQSLYGNAGDQLAKIPNLTMAHELLAIKDQAERAEFIETHDLSEMSTRELKQAIRERDAARERAEQAEEELDRAKKDAENAEQDTREMEKVLTAAQEAVKEAEMRRDAAMEDAEKAREKQNELKAQLKKLRENPEIPDDVMAAMRKDAETKATEELEKKWRDKEEKAKKQMQAAEEEARRAKETAQRLQAQLATAAPEMAVFSAHFKTIQEDWEKLTACAEQVRQNQPDKIESLKRAAKAVLESFMGKAEAW